MIKTTIIQKQIEHTIVETTEKDIRRRIASAFKDILNDYDLELQKDREMFQSDFNRLTDIMEQLDRHAFFQVFRDCYTDMALGPNDFDQVDQWFVDNEDSDNKIEIHVKGNDGQIYIVEQEDIQF